MSQCMVRVLLDDGQLAIHTEPDLDHGLECAGIVFECDGVAGVEVIEVATRQPVFRSTNDRYWQLPEDKQFDRLPTYCVVVERVVETTWSVDVQAIDSDDAEAQVRRLIAEAGGRPEDCDRLTLLGDWAQKNDVHIASGVRQ